MPAMPPQNQEQKYTEDIQRLGLGFRAAAIAGHDFLSPFAARLQTRLAKGLRQEGLDGDGWRSRFLRRGDAGRTASWICEPLRACAADLYNCSINMTTFLKRFQIGYVDAIADARNAKSGADDDVVVVR
jgi:hypothetical protein